MVRRTVEHVRIFEEFAEAIKIAQSSVLIVDRHLFSEDGKNPNHKVRIDRVADWFLTSQIKSLKILTGHHDSQNYIKKTFDTLQELITEERDRAGTPLKIEISFALKDFDYIHDRFAIVDNELWHFGATVGGFHRDVNAASRGWDAELHRAVQFFDLAWMHSNKNGSNTS